MLIYAAAGHRAACVQYFALKCYNSEFIPEMSAHSNGIIHIINHNNSAEQTFYNTVVLTVILYKFTSKSDKAFLLAYFANIIKFSAFYSRHRQKCCTTCIISAKIINRRLCVLFALYYDILQRSAECDFNSRNVFLFYVHKSRYSTVNSDFFQFFCFKHSLYTL